MNNNCAFLVLLLLALTSCHGDSQCELRLKNLQEIRDNHWSVIDPGFLTVGEYLQMDEQRQRYYLDGIVDGMRVAPFLGAYDQTYPESKLRSLLYCVASWGNERKAIVDDFFIAHPGRPEHRAHVLIYVALSEACNDMIKSCTDATCQGYSKI
jgi:hypothetical protein